MAMLRAVLTLAVFVAVAFAAEEAEPAADATAEPAAEAPHAANSTEAEEPLPELPPLKLDEDVACAACETVVDRIYAAILNVSADARDKPMKQRKEIATKIIRSVCYGTRGMSIAGKNGSRYFKYPTPPKKKNATDTGDDEVDDAEVAEEEEAEEEAELEENDADRLLYKACYYIMATEGWKLRSRIAGFYKETSRHSLTKRLCRNSLGLCTPPRAPRLKKAEKCLVAAFKNLEAQKWDKVVSKSDCAKVFTVKPEREKAEEGSKKKKKKKDKKSKKKKKDKKSKKKKKKKDADAESK